MTATVNRTLRLYNSLTRRKDLFQPLAPPYVGLYVCGPTVYNNVHLGNVRTFLTFDILFRYLKHLDYKVRYVRNITDVGHLVGDGDEGEDKIGRIAKLEKIEPMEVVHRYTIDFHQVMSAFNMLPPSIEPTATGHLLEQIAAVQKLIELGMAYESQGSVYFDIDQYNQRNASEGRPKYGELSGRVLEDLLNQTRELAGQSDKHSPLDFAVWKKAAPEHLMQWESPWGMGFPGWHLECTCMSSKYLGTQFDIHGGGMDLKFPHHECEIAQAVGLNGAEPVRYWMHSNMLTVNGQKMSKSLGNSFLPSELVAGSHPLLRQAFSPMTVRFFMLQSHYRSTLDFTNDALIAAQRGFRRLENGLKNLQSLVYEEISEQEPNPQIREEISQAISGFYDGMNDDLNTSVALAHLFTLLKHVNVLYTGQEKTGALGKETFELLKEKFAIFFFDILGLKEERPAGDAVLQGMLSLYRDFKAKQNYEKVDEIRKYFKQQGLIIRDMKHISDWAYEE